MSAMKEISIKTIKKMLVPGGFVEMPVFLEIISYIPFETFTNLINLSKCIAPTLIYSGTS